jgi:hypothetical protein
MLFIRLLFILAVLSNIGIYIYNRQHVVKPIKFTPFDAGVQQLTLLSELDDENTIWEESEDDKGIKQSDEIFNQECYTVGVFNSKSEIRPILDILKEGVIKIRTRKVISSQEAGYWVFIPTKQSREEALNISRELTKFGIKDHYVVTGGENENTLSLGLYRDKQNADARLQEVLSRGFKAEKQVRIEQWPEFWLDYAIASDKVKSLPNINETNPDVSTNKVECNW